MNQVSKNPKDPVVCTVVLHLGFCRCACFVVHSEKKGKKGSNKTAGKTKKPTATKKGKQKAKGKLKLKYIHIHFE